jgi:hypothetical protein
MYRKRAVASADARQILKLDDGIFTGSRSHMR